MSKTGVRLIHSGGFRLELPLHGVAEVPKHLRSAFLEAPYEATRQVFDAVLAEEADCLVLTGDLLDCALTGPRGPLFLVEQMDRLREHNIPVYWAAGQIDSPERWPAGIVPPDNVHVFPSSPTSLVVEIKGRAAAELVGASHDRRRALRPAMFRPTTSDICRVAVVAQAWDSRGLADQSFDYWALGGRHRRSAVNDSTALAHWPGSPQGRNPRETGAHGCTLVELNDAGRPRLRFVPTDLVRFHQETLELPPPATLEQLPRMMRDRVTQLRSTAVSSHVVRWLITGAGAQAAQLRHGPLAGELIAWLRREFGESERAVWSLDVDVQPSTTVSSTDETLLGEFLREIHALQDAAEDETETPPPWHGLLADDDAEALADTTGWHDPRKRRRIIADAAELGAGLLGAPHFEIPAGRNR